MCSADAELKRSFQNQKHENQKMQSTVTTLKSEKTNLQQHLLVLKRRVAELEMMIGEDHQWVSTLRLANFGDQTHSCERQGEDTTNKVSGN